MAGRSSNLKRSLALIIGGLAFLGGGVLVQGTASADAVDLSAWTKESYPLVDPNSYGPAVWTVAGDALSVVQEANGPPTLFYSDFNAFGADAQVTIRVTGGDKDYMGFVLGFEPGDSTDVGAEYWLIDWKKESQFWNYQDASCPGGTAQQGLALSRVFGVPVADEFWNHADLSCPESSGGLSEIVRGLTRGNVAWAPNTDYVFDFQFDATTLKVWVNGDLEIDETGTFSDGRLGFFNFSQPGVTYSAQVPPPADLRPDKVDVKAAASVDCQTLGITGEVLVDVSNVGGEGAGPYAVAVFEDSNGDGLFDGGDNLLGAGQGAGVGASLVEQVAVPVSGTLLFSNNLVYTFVDSLDQVVEADETNNILSSGATCEFQPPAGVFDPVVECAWTGSDVLPASDQVMMTPAVVDLEGDTVPDVIFSSFVGGTYNTNGTLRAIRGSDCSEVFTVTNPAYELQGSAAVAVGDIDLDGRPEILAVHESGNQIIAFEHDGSFKWISPAVETLYWGGAALADLDLDGTPEVVVGRTVLNNDGSVRWTGTGGVGRNGSTRPLSLVANLDLLGDPEVVAGNTAYRSNGAAYWQNTSVPDGFNAIGDFDVDDFPEIVLVALGNVYLLEHTGVIKWGPVALPGGGWGGPPTVADFDGDGQPEIGVAGLSKYTVFETDGSVKWNKATQDVSSARTGSSVFDFENDGSAEVLYRDELKLRVYRGTDGAILWETPMSSGTTLEYPLVVDVDADNNAEIVVVANDYFHGDTHGVYIYSDALDNWVNTRRIWNQHTYHVTNVNDDGTIPQVEENSWQTNNTYRLNLRTEGPAFAAPDLSASFVRIDDANLPASADVIARVGNGGAISVPAGVDVAFYNGDPAAGGILIDVAQTSVALAPGEFEDVAITWPTPPHGIQTVHVVADDDGTQTGAINECCEHNNTCMAQLVVPPSATLDLTPESAANMIGTEHTVTATVRVNGLPISGVKVDFDAYGANVAAPGTDVTDENGEATFTYRGTSTGDDIILAEATPKGQSVEDSVAKTWTEVPGAGTIFPVSGGGVGDGLSASGTTAPAFFSPSGVALAPDGSLYVADRDHHRVRRILPSPIPGDGNVDGDADEIVETVAGSGIRGGLGEGIHPLQARLDRPAGIALGPGGRLYVADSGNVRVRLVDAGADGAVDGGSDEIIRTLGGTPGLVSVAGIAVRGDGSLLVADPAGCIVYEVSAGGDGVVDGGPGETWTPIAGTGVCGFDGDGSATGVQLNDPQGVVEGADGSVYIADSSNSRVRRVSGGAMTTVADATSLVTPVGVAEDGSGNLYVGDAGGHRIYRVEPGVDGIVDGSLDETISSIAGSGLKGFSGDGTPATSKRLNEPSYLDVTDGGTVFFGDLGNHLVRRVAGTSLATVGGSNTEPSENYCIGGVPAIGSCMYAPGGIAIHPLTGELFMADTLNHRVRKVESGTGAIITVAGSGIQGSCASGGIAVDECLNAPEAIAFDSAGTLYVADTGNGRVLEVNLGNGTSSELLTGLSGPTEIRFDAADNLYIAEAGADLVRRMPAGGGPLVTVAGGGAGAPCSSGVAATAVQLQEPTGLAIDAKGNLFIAEAGSHCVRRVEHGGDGTVDGGGGEIISTVAGTGTPGFTDVMPAILAQLNRPYRLDFDPRDGALFIADQNNDRVRTVVPGADIQITGQPDEVIATVAGGGTPNEDGYYCADPGDPTSSTELLPVGDLCPSFRAGLSVPGDVKFGTDGTYYIADSGNDRVRKVPRDCDLDGLTDAEEDALALNPKYAGLDKCDTDSDDDGCADSEELSLIASAGGQRNPVYFWDVMDVPTGSILLRDKAVSVADIAAIVLRFGTFTEQPPTKEEALPWALSPPPPPPEYHPAYDRGGSDLDQGEYHLLGPDGAMSVGDIFATVKQFGMSCRAVP